MKILVLQHLPVEHPGIFRDLLRRDGLIWDTVELDRGDRIPPLETYAFMLVMGGPQDVWQEDQHPWLAAEKAAIRRFVVDMRRPYLGICLGHQLLAEAIGGRVGLSLSPEVGVMTVEKTASSRRQGILEGLENPFTVLQWHSAEVQALPPGTRILAQSENCRVQAFQYQDHAFGLQFHIEITDRTVPEWAAVPAYAKSLERMLGANALGRLQAGVLAELPSVNANAGIIYQNLQMARCSAVSAFAPAAATTAV
jgi:GMP synthase-like glutamine amidotransferase